MKQYLRLILNIVIPLAGWLLLLFLGPGLLRFFLPFVVGWLLSMLANPLVRLMEKRLKIVRRHSSLLVVAAALALVIGLLFFLTSKLWLWGGILIRKLPALYEEIRAEVMRGAEHLDRLFLTMPEGVRESWRDLDSNFGTYLSRLVEKAASPTMEAAGNVAKRIPSVMVYSVVTILSAYFFIVDREEILTFLRKHMPQGALSYQNYLKNEVRHLVCGYFAAQFKIMGVVWLLLTAGFLVLGVHFAPLWALLIAILDFLPVFGTGTALIPWSLIRLLEGEYAFAVGLLLLYALTQVVRQVVQPKLVGDSLGLHPLSTLFFLYLGFKFGGIAGMILAVPLGMFFVNLYHYGAFQNITENLRQLIEAVNDFRRDTPEKEDDGKSL